MSKYKYYFSKPRSEICKDILKGLIIAGAVGVAATSPYFVPNLIKNINKYKIRRRRIYDTFYNLRRQGYLNIEKRNHQLYVTLTEEGKKAAGRFQIDDLEIKKPSKWDKKWRLVIFDISELKRTKRELFRRKIKDIGLLPLQRSVWVHPYNCKDEIDVLREFFGLGKKEIRFITTDSVEDDAFLRKIFQLD